jgi:WD40 repeat protein
MAQNCCVRYVVSVTYANMKCRCGPPQHLHELLLLLLPLFLSVPAACSISWSPDGELLLAVNASSGGQPTTALFKRQTWDTTHLVGHRSSVVAAAANPRMFFAPRKLQAARRAAADRMLRQVEGDGSDDDGEDQQQQEDAAAARADSADAYDDMPSMVCACSSNDKTFTVWSSELALPVLHCQQVLV